MKKSLETLIDKIIDDIKVEDIRTVVLDDRDVDSSRKTVPMLMVVGRLNQRLLEANLRHLISIVAITGRGIWMLHMSGISYLGLGVTEYTPFYFYLTV